MFPSLGSLTGGGGLSLSNSSSAKSGASNGGIHFGDSSSPFSAGGSSLNTGLIVGAVVLLAYVVLKAKK